MFREELTPHQRGVRGGAVTLADLLFATIVLAAMLLNEQSTVSAIIAASVVYGLTTGTFADLIIVWRATQPLPELERPRVHLTEPPLRHLPDVTRTFVAPVDDSTRNAALGWVAQLYTAEGDLDGKKLSLGTGRVRCGMPGKAAVEYLMARGLLKVAVKDGHPNGYLFDAPTLPRRHLALNRI